MNNKELQIKNSIIYFLPTIISNLIPLLTLPIFTRILTKEDYGALALAHVYAIFMTGIANFGLTIGYERNFFEYKNPKQSAELLYTTLLFVISIFFFLAFFTYLFKSYLAKWIIGSEVHANLLFWAFFSTFFSSTKIYFLTYYKNTENAKSFVWFTINETLITAVLSLFFVIYLRIGVMGLIWGQLFSCFINFGRLSFNFLHSLPFRLDWSVFKGSLKLSYPLTPRIFFNVLGNQFDKFLLGLLDTTGGVGIYFIGQKISYVVFTFMTTLQNVYSPQVYRRMFRLGNNGGEVIGKYLTPYVYISTLIALLVALFSQEVIVVLFPITYHGAIDIVTILSMLYGSYFFGKQPQLIFAKKTFITSTLTFVHIGLNVGLNIPFIIKWGALGAAWATFMAGLISGSISFLVSQHYYKIKWEYPHLVYIFFTFLGSSTLLILLRQMNTSYIFLLLFKIMVIGAYCHAGFKCKVINTENYLYLKNMLLKSS
jgi:O-antigen/teichoic acid export membrane protein